MIIHVIFEIDDLWNSHLEWNDLGRHWIGLGWDSVRTFIPIRHSFLEDPAGSSNVTFIIHLPVSLSNIMIESDNMITASGTHTICPSSPRFYSKRRKRGSVREEKTQIDREWERREGERESRVRRERERREEREERSEGEGERKKQIG